jgi:hypothetical protein
MAYFGVSQSVQAAFIQIGTSTAKIGIQPDSLNKARHLLLPAFIFLFGTLKYQEKIALILHSLSLRSPNKSYDRHE